jgi:hypothetical protein
MNCHTRCDAELRKVKRPEETKKPCHRPFRGQLQPVQYLGRPWCRLLLLSAKLQSVRAIGKAPIRKGQSWPGVKWQHLSILARRAIENKLPSRNAKCLTGGQERRWQGRTVWSERADERMRNRQCAMLRQSADCPIRLRCSFEQH